MKVKDIMTRDIACITTDDSIEKAARLMKEHDVGSIPVCDHNEVIGIVTDRDITLRSVAIGQTSTSQRKVSDVMSTNIVVGNPDMDVHDAAKIMSEQQIRRLPIVENKGLVGIVALSDISLEPTLKDNAEDTLKSISQPGGKHT